MSASVKYITQASPRPVAETSGGRVAEVPFRRLANIRSAAQRRIRDIIAVVADNDAAGFIVPVDDIAYAFAQTRLAVSSGFAFKAVMSERVDRETGEIIRRPVRTKAGARVYSPYRFTGCDDDVRRAVIADLEAVGWQHEYCAATFAVINVDRENNARRSSGLISGDAIADIFRVTLAQRDRLKLSTFGAVDIRKVERQAKAKDRKRVTDRDKVQAKRLDAKPSTKPRTVYEQTSAETLKPWIAEGISRRTWYRRRKHAGTPEALAQVCRDGYPTDIITDATHLCQPQIDEASARSASPSPQAGGGEITAPAAQHRSTGSAPSPSTSARRRQRSSRASELRPERSTGQLEFWPQPQSSAGATATARLDIEPQSGPLRRRENLDVRESSEATHLCSGAAA